MIERTLILIKPDGIQRCLTGKIISRFEDAGLKIIGMKMKCIDENFAKKHYTEDIEKRRGKFVRDKLIGFITEGPVLAMCIEGVNAIENVRKLVGDTEPRKSMPGTIRGDFAHVTYDYADGKNVAVKNLVHASADKNDAENEVKLWFSGEELHSYKTVHDVHVL
ncbi:nucleoside-diphosphate kinase [Candidatus Woesearchaeota archaeon]|nr:nucleoside-diphosphate kinase [Candidatus Woesearchaeota archaeon]